MKSAAVLVMSLAFVAMFCGIAPAQDAQMAPGSERPMYKVLKPSLRPPESEPGTGEDFGCNHSPADMEWLFQF